MAESRGMDYLHNTGLDRILDDMEKIPMPMNDFAHDSTIWGRHPDDKEMGRESEPISAPQAPNPPQPTPEAETPRKTAPGGQETGEDGERWDGLS